MIHLVKEVYGTTWCGRRHTYREGKGLEWWYRTDPAIEVVGEHQLHAVTCTECALRVKEAAATLGNRQRAALGYSDSSTVEDV